MQPIQQTTYSPITHFEQPTAGSNTIYKIGQALLMTGLAGKSIAVNYLMQSHTIKVESYEMSESLVPAFIFSAIVAVSMPFTAAGFLLCRSVKG